MPQRHYEKMRYAALLPSHKSCSQTVTTKDRIRTKPGKILTKGAPSSFRRFDVASHHYDGFNEVRKS